MNKPNAPVPAHMGVSVSVKTHFMKAQSRPDKKRFVFSYTITISNNGTLSAQLLSRHWIITSGDTLQTQEVQGDGVIGQQPHIKPGEHFTYTSGSVMDSPVGIMQGSYRFIDEQGEYMDVTIEPFTLAAPNTVH